MSNLDRKDHIELAVGVVALAVYLGLWATGSMPENTPILVHVIIGAAAVAIFGDNLLTWLDKAPT